jgi:hypothetical protein
MNDFGILFVGIAFIALLFGAGAGCTDAYGRYQCKSYAQLTGKETKWNTLDCCYIKTAEGWQRWDEYTKRAIASEGLKQGPTQP